MCPFIIEHRLVGDPFDRAFLTKVDTGFVKKKCCNEGIERGFDSIKTWIALVLRGP